MCWWDRWLWELGFAICHQRPERIFRYDGCPLFVCARDTGLLVGFFTLLLVLSLLRARGRAGMPPPPILFLAAGGVLFLAWDGFTSYLGWRESSNLLRFLSGFAAGAGLAFPAASLFNRWVFGGDRSLKVGAGFRDLLFAVLAAGAVLALYLWRPAFIFRLGQLWLLVCFLGTFWSLNLLLVCLFQGREGGGITWSRAVLAVFLTAAELTISYTLHRILEGRGAAPA
ncbi:MAG: DUF2085 domain-containing protein [Actinomycetota bacterium]